MDQPRTFCVSIVISLKERKPDPEIPTFYCEQQPQNHIKMLKGKYWQIKKTDHKEA